MDTPSSESLPPDHQLGAVSSVSLLISSDALVTSSLLLLVTLLLVAGSYY